MKFIKKLPYDEVDFLWVRDHYDYHLEGLCMYEGKIARFETNWNTPRSTGDNPRPVSIFALTPWERFRARLDKKAFEICVGYHWSYGYPNHSFRETTRVKRWVRKMYYKIIKCK